MKVSSMDKKVVNYLIYNLLQGNSFNDIDLGFLDDERVRGTRELWRTIYGTIKAQLSLNPNDIDGYSITPIWVRKIYQEYRQTDYHDCWSSEKVNLESVPNMIQDVIHVKKPDDTFVYFYSPNEGKTLHRLPHANESVDFIKGYLVGVNATHLYKVKILDSTILTNFK